VRPKSLQVKTFFHYQPNGRSPAPALSASYVLEKERARGGQTMGDSGARSHDRRELTLRYPARCATCSASLPANSRAVWNSSTKTARCLPCAVPVQAPPPPIEVAPLAPVDFGVAGASAQRLFDAKEARRRARLRANWWALLTVAVIGAIVGGYLGHRLHSSPGFWAAVGAAIPVLDVIRRPQHIDAWRVGAAGERAVGRMLEGLRAQGVVAIHDRRVPGRSTNIDHIAVSPAGVFVVDTKNVAGKVTASRSGLRVAGRRQDKMLDGVIFQVAVVQRVLDELPGPLTARGVLCFTKAELPWLRPQPRGVALLYPRGLRKMLTKGATVLSRDQVNLIATMVATRLPAA